MFSPLGVKEVFGKAVKEENGNIDNIFKNKKKYKQLIEMWHASFLSVAIYKWLGKKFYLIPADGPDVYFVDKKASGEQEGFPVEVMELYNYGQVEFDGGYQTLAEKVWKSKGKKSYGNCELLLVTRMQSKAFNIVKFAEFLNKYKWPYIRIWLSSYNSSTKLWTIFEIIPYTEEQQIKYLSVHLNEQLF